MTTETVAAVKSNKKVKNAGRKAAAIAYKVKDRRLTNKIRKMKNHAKKFPADVQAEKAISAVQKNGLKPKKKSGEKSGWVNIQGNLHVRDAISLKHRTDIYTIKPTPTDGVVRKAVAMSEAKYQKRSRALNLNGANEKYAKGRATYAQKSKSAAGRKK